MSCSTTHLLRIATKTKTNLQRLCLVAIGALVACGGSSSSREFTDAGSSPTHDGSVNDGGVAGDAGSPSDAGVTAVNVPLSGCYNVHTADVTIGTQSFALLVDTGSSTIGVAAATCESCADAGVTPLYEPGPSATDQHDTISSKYDTGEVGWTGEGYEDTVSVGGLPTAVKFSAISAQNNYFQNFPCDTPTNLNVVANTEGIIGFAPNDILLAGSTEYFSQLVATDGTSNIFSLNYCHLGGTLWLGGYDHSLALQYAPLLANTMANPYYEITWNSFAVGSAAAVSLAAPSDAIIDSGGYGLIVPSALYTQIVTPLQANANVKAKLGANFFSSTATTAGSHCVAITDTPATIDSLFPTLTLTFGNASVTLTATESYLLYSYVSATQTEYCQDVINGTATYGNSFYYLGQVLMRNHTLVYDRVQERVGISARGNCAY